MAKLPYYIDHSVGVWRQRGDPRLRYFNTSFAKGTKLQRQNFWIYFLFLPFSFPPQWHSLATLKKKRERKKMGTCGVLSKRIILFNCVFMEHKGWPHRTSGISMRHCSAIVPTNPGNWSLENVIPISINGNCSCRYSQCVLNMETRRLCRRGNE